MDLSQNTHFEKDSDVIGDGQLCFCQFFLKELFQAIRQALKLTVLPSAETNRKNSVALVRERTIPTERPPPVGEVSANFCG